MRRAAEPGVEPGPTYPEYAVLPLHHPANRRDTPAVEPGEGPDPRPPPYRKSALPSGLRRRKVGHEGLEPSTSRLRTGRPEPLDQCPVLWVPLLFSPELRVYTYSVSSEHPRSSTLGRSRTCVRGLRRPVPHPLGHEGIVLGSNRILSPILVGVAFPPLFVSHALLSGPIAGSVGRREGVAVGAEQTEILLLVVVRVSIHVIHLERDGFSQPFYEPAATTHVCADA
jgi:hypothetical protein